jgi:hypothetical protein
VWQGEVRDAYARCCAANAWGGPNHPSPITSSDTGSLEVPPASSPTVPSLETFVWAVAAVQSRAFAFVVSCSCTSRLGWPSISRCVYLNCHHHTCMYCKYCIYSITYIL